MPYAFQVGAHASIDRLERLIAQRLEPGSDKQKIDQKIWDLFGEKLAVMFTDLSGFSRGVAEFGIIHFLQIIYESQRILIPCIDDHEGILLKLEGDSMLITFRSVTKAMECAIAMQRTLKKFNKDRDDKDKVLLCLGLGYGPMLRIGDDDVFGAQVNAASKLGEDVAGPEEILVTESVRNSLDDFSGLQYLALDEVPPGAKAAYRVDYSSLLQGD